MDLPPEVQERIGVFLPLVESLAFSTTSAHLTFLLAKQQTWCICSHAIAREREPAFLTLECVRVLVLRHQKKREALAIDEREAWAKRVEHFEHHLALRAWRYGGAPAMRGEAEVASWNAMLPPQQRRS